MYKRRLAGKLVIWHLSHFVRFIEMRGRAHAIV